MRSKHGKGRDRNVKNSSGGAISKAAGLLVFLNGVVGLALVSMGIMFGEGSTLAILIIIMLSGLYLVSGVGMVMDKLAAFVAAAALLMIHLFIDLLSLSLWGALIHSFLLDMVRRGYKEI